MQTYAPLAGFTVLDASTVIAGPLCATILADLGARVIKVERPGAGDDSRRLGRTPGSSWAYFGRNKECVTCNMSSPEGRALFKELVGTVDVVIQNFRPGALEKWDLSFETLKQNNPGLIMLSISGFGKGGPYSHKPGYGALAESIAGLVNVTGEKEGRPTLPGAPIADPMTSTFGAVAIVTALLKRQMEPETWQGQEIDISLYGGLLYALGNYVAEFDISGQVPQRGEQLGKRFLRDVAQCADGQWVAYAAVSGALIRNVVAFLIAQDPQANAGLRPLLEGPIENVAPIGTALKGWIAQRDRSTAIAQLEAADIPVAPIYSIEGITRDEHFTARHDLVTAQDHRFGAIRMPILPFRANDVGSEVKWSGRRLGEDNAGIYGGMLGLSQAKLDELELKGVI